MRWEPLTEASEALGLSKNTLRSKGGRNGWPRREDRRGNGGSGNANHNRYVYAVPEDIDEAIAYRVDRWVDEDGSVITFSAGPSEASRDDDDQDEFEVVDPVGGPYAVIGENYVFNLPSKPRTPWVVHKGEVERMVTAYSKDGDNATYNQLSREFGYHRKTIQEMLKALGKTHDSLPFTDEQIADTDEDDLVEDLVRRKEEKVHVRAERIDWKKTRDLADRARRWEDFVANSMNLLKVPPPPAMPTWKRDRIRRNGSAGPSDSRITVVSHATDLHYGKYGWVDQVGEEFSREVCRDRLMSTTAKLIDRIFAWGEPDEVILGVGGDWFHIDNHRYQTTRGTPQDTDGTFMQVFQEGCALARDHIELWRQAVAKVRLVCVPGNHDYLSTSMLVHWLQAKYDGADDVEVGRSVTDREYLKIGNTILGMTHGDRTKDQKLGALMSVEAKEWWSETVHRLILTGHWHSQRVNEEFGVIVEHLPSLAGTDAWHHAHGYIGNRKALMAHLIDHQEGPFAKVLADAK